jgi:hypothetical protein
MITIMGCPYYCCAYPLSTAIGDGDGDGDFGKIAPRVREY